MVLNIAHFRKQIVNNWRVLKCGAGGSGEALFNCVGNGVLPIGKEENYSLPTINRRTGNLIGHILHGNCLTKHDISLNVSWKVRRGRKKKKKT
jgi:hypothetical protein